MKTAKKHTSVLFLAAAFLIVTAYQAAACTRVNYRGPNGTIITARSMDWKTETKSNLWLFPRGMQRDGATGPKTVKWVSKYGSIVTSFTDNGSTDGMNEKGLVANLLWLAESEYPKTDLSKPGISIGTWVQYVLDNFATVKEAVDFLAKGTFAVYSDKMPGSDLNATLHMAISDASGDNAIFEYIKGKLVISHNPSYQVMTNSPIFEKQLALAEYWNEIGGTVMLPGTNRAADRFVRASFYINAIPKTADTLTALASVFSVIRNCSVPYGISTPSQPNISSTRWRTVADQKNRVYYFDSVTVPSVFWVDLKKVDFSKTAKTKKLTLEHNEFYSGDTLKEFKEAKPFTFAGI
ncbi:MAG: Choloylglycine hydrolase [Syntrophus sp. SKADARSKE-3]|nr:Choloylglycine hydrolase [Syntrophus sp. SKADARSKE-3]